MKILSDIAQLACGKRALNCESCGVPFECGASLAGCWCSEVKLPAEARIDLRAKYSDCLCRECLEKGASASETTLIAAEVAKS